MKKILAFTLAETLIVMGIIGVVAALTIPNLNSSTNDKEKVAKVKKIFSNLQDAYGRAEASYGPIDEWYTEDGTDTTKRTKRVGERLTEFMKITKNCQMTANQGCFKSGNAKNVKNGSYETIDDTSHYQVITSDGTSIAFAENGSGVVKIHVDIDGASKGSFTMGKDLFFFNIGEDKNLVPGETANITFANTVKELKNTGREASNWIIHYDNMDYLKFTDENGKCTNGSTVNETHPSCK